eukprot:6112567-Amphidinium_carterae.1
MALRHLSGCYKLTTLSLLAVAVDSSSYSTPAHTPAIVALGIGAGELKEEEEEKEEEEARLCKCSTLKLA